MYKAIFEIKNLSVVATEQCETKMDKVKCNDKENEIVKEKSEESRGLTFPLQDSGELPTPFLSCFKSFGRNYRDLFNCC